MPKPGPRGRGSHINPPNRFEREHHEPDWEHLEHDEEYWERLQNPATQYIPDRSQTIVVENDSPDVGFRFSINPYRGCMHGCAYCYARPTHEYLGWSAGLDFETKILVKEDAPALFRDFLCRPGWQPESIALSGVTDCYQPAERRYRLTRGCLEVALEARQPMGIITKNALILRDLDLLREMAMHNLLAVFISVTTLDAELARTMEPRTSIPAMRLKAIQKLSSAGIPVGVLIAPVIPGLNDEEIPSILRAVAEAGARTAGHVLLRLPLAVAPVFQDWLARTQPERKERIESRIRSTREGKLNQADFVTRMTGTGEIADQIRKMFRLFRKRYKLDGGMPEQDCTQFRPPTPRTGQGWLF